MSKPSWSVRIAGRLDAEFDLVVGLKMEQFAAASE
jgi:hypothetical protein